MQQRAKATAGTILGTGKLQEIAEEAKRNHCETLIFDFELTASQVRNIKKITKLEVLDRCNVILEIFAQHARTKEAKIQIEISKLEYLFLFISNVWEFWSLFQVCFPKILNFTLCRKMRGKR